VNSAGVTHYPASLAADLKCTPEASAVRPARFCSKPNGQRPDNGVSGHVSTRTTIIARGNPNGERLVRERERYREVPGLGADVARISERIAAIDAEDSAAAQAHHHRQHLRARAVALAKARVLDFAGAPGVQMQLAGRLCGQCFHCFRALTDPISLERGIGPDCLENKVAWIKSRERGERRSRYRVLVRHAGGFRRRSPRSGCAAACSRCHSPKGDATMTYT
jgi:hypothetical protein